MGTAPIGPRVAIVHDDLTQRGGAERVVLSLLRLFPDADLYAGVYDADGTFDEFREHDVRTTGLQRLPHRGNAARALLPLYPGAFRRLVLRGYDLVISSSSRFAHHVTVEGGTHVCYCYSPARFLYRTDDYFARGAPVPVWFKWALRPILGRLEKHDRAAATQPDRYIAVSNEAAARIVEVYGRKADVVPPPVEVGRFAGVCGDLGPDVVPDEPYLLVVSRLLPYKRIDLAIEVAEMTGHRLVVVGEGPSRPLLEARAGSSVELRGTVSNAELAALLHGCVALLQAGVEDFGLMPLEANAAGRPVVARAAGGALETVIDGVTGVLVDDDTAEAFAAAIERVECGSWRPDLLRRHADWFAEPRFHAQLIDTVAGLVDGVTAPAAVDVRPLTSNVAPTAVASTEDDRTATASVV